MNRIIGVLGPRRSIRSNIFFSIIFFLVVPFLISFYYIDRPLEAVIEGKIGSSSQDALSLVNMNVDVVMQDMFKMATELATSREIVDMLNRPQQMNEYEWLQIKQNILQKLTYYNFTAYVAVLDGERHFFSSRYTEQAKFKELTQSAWYAELVKDPGKLIWLYGDNYTFADASPVISLAKSVFDPYTKKPIGVLLFSVSEEDIGKYLTKLDGAAYMLDRDGIVISGPDESKIGTPVSREMASAADWTDAKGQTIMEKDGGKWIVNYSTIQQTGWKIVQVIPYDKVFKQIFDIRKANIMITVVIFVIFILITLTISYNISKPLKLLGKKMLDFENQDPDGIAFVKGPKEIALLAGTYNKMLRHIKELLQRLKEQYQQKEELRFQALQAQINPHFILNTLNNIKWMAYIRGDREVGDMLSNLGGIMESALGRGENLIPLRRELDYIRNYTSLMKMKYNEKLSVTIDVPDELLSMQAIQFMLQPIIENSIGHGIERLQGMGEIAIRAEKREEHMAIRISDNGVGMDEEKLHRIRTSLSLGPEGGATDRIGLKNVHDRIRLQYGAPYGLSIESAPGAGTTVTLKLPCKATKERSGEYEANESDFGGR